MDEGEEPEAAAVRECHEEIGQVPDTVVRLASLLPDARVTATRRWSSSGCRVSTTPTEAAAMDEDEDIEPRTFALAEAREMVRRGEIVDMKTVAGLALI